ncbi:MAG: translocation/assembly module TamB domain-containing protein [Pseudomonadota bacterium]|nr:translocation/assembly module TamB domain-containing protein [Pseudomonadota bacterium]
MTEPDASPQTAPTEEAAPKPRRRRRLWLRLPLAILLQVMLLLLLILAWVLGTQSGLRFALGLVEDVAPGVLQVERADGRILGDLHLSGVQIRVPDLELDVGGIDLRWSPLAALGGTLRIRELSVRDLDILMAPAEEEKEEESAPIELPTVILPLSLELEQVLVERLSYGAPGDAPPFRVDRIALAASLSGSEVILKDLVVALPEPQFSARAKGRAELRGNYPLDLGLDWDLEQLPAIVLTGKAQVGGDLQRLTVEHDLNGSAEAKLDAVVQAVLDAPSWEGTLEIQGLDLPAFAADLPAADLTGRLTTSGDLADARVQGTLTGEAPDLPDFGRLNAELDVTWRDQVLNIAALELTEDKSGAHLTADGLLDLNDPAGRFELAAAWERLRWPLTGDIVAEARQGKVDASGTFEDFRYQASADLWGRDFPEAALRLTGDGDLEGTRIEALHVDTLDGRIEADGRVAWAPELGWELKLTADAIDPGQQWPDVPAKLGLTLTSAGSLAGFEYELDSQIESEVLPVAMLKLKGEGDMSGTRLEALRLDSLGGHVEGKAELGWEPAVRWDAQLTAEGIDPGKQWPEWAGHLGGEIASAGSLEAEGPDLTAVVEGFKGELRGYPVEAVAKVAMKGSEIKIEQLQIASGPSILRAKGDVGEQLGLDFDLISPDLKSLLPDASGSVKASGTASGTLKAPAVKLELSADKVEMAGQGIDRLRGKADLDLAQGGRINVDLAGERLLAGGMLFDSLQVKGEGDMASHRLSAQARGEPLALDMRAAGSLKEDNAYEGRVTGLEVRSQDFGDWRLQKPAAVALAGARIEAGPVCIRDGGGSGGCASFLQKETGSWDAQLDLDRLAFDLLAAFIPEGLLLEGEARAKANFQASGGVLKGNASVQVPKGVVSADTQDRLQVLDFSAARVGIDANGAGLQAKLEVPLAGIGSLNGEAALAGWRLDDPARPDQSLRGRVRARVDDLSIVSRFVPDLTDVKGNIDADLGLSGTVGKPGVSGYARLANGGLKVPFIGLEIADLGFNAQAKGLERIDYEGGFRAGKGRLEIDGNSSLGKAGLVTRVKAAGESLKLADSKEYFALVSPNVELEIDPDGTSVTGEVKVPEARIRPRTIPAGTVSPSPDVVLDSQAREQTRYSTNIDVRLVLGKSVEIDAFGLRGMLAGDLRVLQEVGKELLGDGQVKIVDGSYRIARPGGMTALTAAIGKPLTISQGFLNWAKSPLANPFMVLTAQREGGDITAGLRVFGTIRNPKMTFFSASDPGMTQAEVSNYLITGIPPKRGQEDPTDQALSVGRYVAPKLFMEYDYSLGDQADKIKLRYDLNDWIELQTETGDSQGGDIFFKIER